MYIWKDCAIGTNRGAVFDDGLTHFPITISEKPEVWIRRARPQIIREDRVWAYEHASP
jgi:hypothetical protein